MQSLEAVLFDLDGTLVDSKPGIIASMMCAFETCGMEPPDCEAIVIGAPIQEIVSTLLGADRLEHRDIVIKAFRQHYKDIGTLLSTPYAGIPEFLTQLRRECPDLRAYIATSKAAPFARHALELLKLDQHFTRIYGAELTGERVKKDELLHHLLEQENLTGESCLMIGDRMFDMIGARTHGIVPVGVTWGYGSADELREHGAVALADSPAQLLEIIFGRMHQRTTRSTGST